MLNLLYQGGPLFMGILSLLFLFILVLTVRALLLSQNKQQENYGGVKAKNIKKIKEIGIFALVTGILGQLIGLYSAFNMMEGLEEGTSSQILAGGLRISTITTLYGIIIFLVSRLGAFFLEPRG